MAGRDLSSELFETPAEPAGTDLSADLFGAPKKTDTVSNPLKPAPTAGGYGLMGENIEPEPTTIPKPSVMDATPSQPPVPKGEPATEQVPVRPEVRQVIRANYIKFLDDPGWKGDIARQRKAELERFAKARKVAPQSRFLEKVSPDVEDRTQRLIEEGEKPEFARVAAEEAAAAGVEPGGEIGYMAGKGLATPLPFDEQAYEEYKDASLLSRGLGKAGAGYKKFVYGVNQAAADLFGAEEYARAQKMSADEARALEGAIGENPDYWKRQTENVVSSIAQQIPTLLGGVATGSEALILGGMFLQTFGQEYSDARAAKQDPNDALQRAGFYGLAEVVGERLGLKFELDAIKKATQGLAGPQLSQWFANFLKKEVPGEQLTTLMQYLTDISPIGLNKTPSLAEYLEQARDTLVQTALQTGVMSGGTKAIGYGMKKLREAVGKPAEVEEPIPTAEQLMREKGFLTKPSRTATGKPTVETVMEEAAGEKAGAPTRVEPTLAPLSTEEKAVVRARQVEDIATKMVETSGIDPDTAMQIAEGRVRAQEEREAKQEQARQDGMQAEVAARPVLVAPAEDRIQEITQDLIGAGMNPIEAAQRATLMAQEEAENDALAEQEGVAYVGKPITEAGGVGAGVLGQRPAGVPAGGAVAPVTARLVPTGEATGELATGETAQPGALTEETNVPKTIETLEAEAQRAAESEAGVPTTAPKKVGRPRLAPEAKLTAEERRKQQRAAYKAVDKQVSNAERDLAQSATPVNEGEATSEAHLREMYADKDRQRQSAINRLYDVSKTNRGKPGERAKALLAQATPRELQIAESGYQLRKQRAESVSKIIEAAAADTVADEKLGKVTNGAQAITQIIKTGTDFQKVVAKRIRSFVSNVKVVVVEANQPLPEALTKNPRYTREWDRARALFIENYATGARTIYVRGASFGADQGVNNITLLHELYHAATNKKLELGRQAITQGRYKNSNLVRATEDLIQIMNNAGDRFNELAAAGKLPDHISRLAQFGEIFDDPREFVAYGMTDAGFQEFLKSTRSIEGATSFWSAFVDALRRLVGMEDVDANALSDLFDATDSILKAKPVGRLDLTEGLSPMGLFGFGDKAKEETPSFAGQTITATPSANAKRLAALLGAKLYGEPTDIARVSVKELFQNSFDAIKGAIENGQLKEGKINIKLDEKARTITITDNGLGMPASVMGNQFLTIAGTVKETDRASGGLGIAKMLFLFGNEKLEVVSLRDGVVARMVTTGEEVTNAFDDPSKSPTITTSSDPSTVETYKNTMFPDGHGTAVVVKIPNTFTDASTGETRDIPFRASTLASAPSLLYSPLFDNIEVTVDSGYGPAELPIGKNFPIDSYTPFANINFAWGTARIYVTKQEQYHYNDNTHILSNGLWQFDKTIKDSPGWGGKAIQRTFYVDVNSKVKPEDAGYPFELNRQGFSPAIQNDFNKIFSYITVIYQQQTLAGESKSFGLIQYVDSNGKLSTPEELEPQAPPTPTAFTMIKPDDKVEVLDGVMYVNGREVPELTDEDLKNATIKIDELTIPQDKIDTNRVMVHDNTLVKGSTVAPELTADDIKNQMPAGWTLEEDKTETGAILGYYAHGPEGALAYGGTIERLIERLQDKHNVFIQTPFKEIKPKTLSEVGREKFGNDYDKYLVGIGDIFMQMRNALATTDNGNYTDILKEAIGLSIDKEYLGVSIRVPFSGMYLNPATVDPALKKTSRQISLAMMGTMMHEMAHHKVRSHDENFPKEMQRIMNLLETHPTYDLAAAKKQFADHIQNYIHIFDFLDSEFTNGNLTARGNRFKDAGSFQTRDDGIINPMEGAGAAGEELGVRGGIEPSYQRAGQVGVGAGAAGQAEEAGAAQQAVRTQKEIDNEVAIAIEKVRISRNAEEVARQSKILQALRDPRKIVPAMRQVWKTATYAQRQLLVKMPTTEFLARWGGSYIPELLNTNVLLEKMSGLTQQLLNSSAIMAKTIHKAFKEDKTLQRKLEDVAYASTLAQVDPSDPNATERSPKLDQMYKDLGAKGQQIFNLILDHYQNMSDYFAQLLDEQIANSRTSIETQNRLMAKIREIYETGQKIKPYIPLVRRGDFFLAVGSGKHRQFFTFETMNERDAAAEAMAKERRTSLDELKADQEFVLGNDISTLRRASFDSSSILKNLFDVIDSEDFSSPDVREELKDSIYQLYLTTMPEQSFRRQFINRKNITGFSTDLLRNFSTTGVKMATQLSKIKYASLLRNSISAAQDSIVGREDLQPFISEMQARINNQLSPGKRTATDRVGDFLNRSAFLWYLSGASSALLQPLGVFQTGAPILMARYGQINGARELVKMLRVWDQYGIWRKNPDGSVSFVPPSIANAQGMTPDEKRAIREMLGRDVSQSTYASALFGYKSVPSEKLEGVVQHTKRGIAVATGGLMHTTERLSREMIYLASYRLNRKAGKSHDESVNQAVIDTNEALGNYGQYNRPLIMQKGLGKIALQFAMYPLHVTLFLMRNFKRMLPLLNKEGKWEAAKIFYGTLGTTMILAGASGLPMFSIVMGVLGALWRDEEKPQDYKDMDYETWWRTVWLPENLGHIEIGGRSLAELIDKGVANAVTGLDIASRTSLNDLWMRDTKETKSARDSAVALAMERAGPSAAMILSLADAYEAFGNGDYQKGIEKMSPALIRNFVLTHKYATEGARDTKGADLILQGGFTTGELLGQAIGFRPEILANPQQVAFKLNSARQRIEIERTKLMNNATREYFNGQRTGNWDGYLKQLEKIEKFSNKYPEFGIDEDQLSASIDKREEQMATTEEWGGMPVDEKFAPIVADTAINATKRLEQRNREVLERRRKEREKK